MKIVERTKFGSIYLHMIQAKNDFCLTKLKEIYQATKIDSFGWLLSPIIKSEQ